MGDHQGMKSGMGLGGGRRLGNRLGTGGRSGTGRGQGSRLGASGLSAKRCARWALGLGLLVASGCALPHEGAPRVAVVVGTPTADGGYMGAAVGATPDGPTTKAPERAGRWRAGPIQWHEADPDELGADTTLGDPEQPAAGDGGDEEDTVVEPPTAGDPTDPDTPTDAESPTGDPDARGEDRGEDPENEAPDLPESWPVVAHCAELQTTACTSNYGCGPALRCEEVGSIDNPVRCCLPGQRGERQVGGTCIDTGDDGCHSGLCLPDGEALRCSRRCGAPDDCPFGMRLCAASEVADDDALWCQADGASRCRLAAPGDLIINEIMVFADTPTGTPEFIELVNTTAEPVALSDLTLRSNRGDNLTDRVVFSGGCLPAGARVALFEDAETWLWSHEPADPPVAQVRRFGFSNSADVRVMLVHRDGTVIDEARAPAALLRRGVSLNRVPDATAGAPLAPHEQVSLAPASPGATP